MQAITSHALALPLMSYGQPLGHLCLQRTASAFDEADLRWQDDVMREMLPLLERSDLLEQLQRETASRERERIGRDLHDSAVQPYLGLKYGLEALSRQAGQQNPIAPHIKQLLHLATEELQNLRDVVSGLRSGEDPSIGSASLVALQRQVKRFEDIYGLKVHIFAPQAPHLRGSVAKAVLHMVNEGLTNVRRHTTATAVTVLLDTHQDNVVMRLRNDHGPGERLARDFIPRSINERAAEFGGTVAVTHEPDFTEIAITLPQARSHRMNPNVATPSQHSSPGAQPIRVLLVDDHALMLWGLRQLVESMRPLMAVSGTRRPAVSCSSTPLSQHTDVVVLDLGLRDANALDCVSQLVSQAGVKVIVLTGDLNPSHHRDAVMRGARGVVLKSQPTEDILQAIERVHAGEVWLDGSLMSMLLGGMPGLAPARGAIEDEHARRNHSLTAKERQVVQAMVQHRGAKGLVVADALGMSEHTLRNHLTVIYSKLGVQGKLNLYVYALEHGLAHAPRCEGVSCRRLGRPGFRRALLA